MSFTHDICVVGGCGHVGLPLAIRFAAAGLRVVIHDVDERAVALVRSGKMPFLEDGAEPLLKETIGRTLEVVKDERVISSARYVIVVIGTPVDEHLSPTFHKMLGVFEALEPRFRDGQCIILRSTVFPGTTERVRSALAAAGKNVSVAFCPERVAEGRAMTELMTLPQIVSGCDDAAADLAAELFSKIASSIIRLAPLEAEFAKIFTNAWRYIQFATANQFFMVAMNYGLDFFRIHEALTRNYPRTAGFPTSGFTAGPCLFKDTMQLAAADPGHFTLGHAAMLINEGLPSFVVRHMKMHYALAKMRVGILGMSFKPDSDDPRESLAYKLRRILQYEAADVLCTDVHVVDDSLVSLEHVLKDSDIFVIGAPHKEYRGLSFPAGKPVIDIWNFYKKGISFN